MDGMVPWRILVVLGAALIVGCYGDHNAHREPKKLHCYDCNSRHDPHCGLDFDNYTIALVDCAQKPRPEHLPSHHTPTVCRKVIQRVHGEVRVWRSCGYLEDHDHDDGSCYMKSGTHDVQLTLCSCTQSACNSAEPQGRSAPIAKLVTLEILAFTTLSALFRMK